MIRLLEARNDLLAVLTAHAVPAGKQQGRISTLVLLSECERVLP